MKRRIALVASTALATTLIWVGPAGAVDSYKLGQRAPSGDLVFIVHGFEDPYTSPNQFSTPKSGNRFLAVDVEVINKKVEQQSWSSALGAEVILKDRQTYTGTFAITAPPAPEGEIPAKFSKRGLIPFEVPVDAQVRYVRLKGNLTSNGALVRLKLPKTAVTPTSAA